MSEPAIIVEHLSKQYRIGLRRDAQESFREAVGGLLLSPLRRLRKLTERTAGADTIWALKDVSLEVQPGEVVGVIGRNGAGKSTLLKVLSRITPPTTGRAMIRGRVGTLLEIGTGFHPELTGRENIYLSGAILGMKKAEIDRRYDEIVAFAELDDFLETPVKRYSSGMYVRLAFAVAAHLEPEILLVDEVLAVGDVGFQRKCLGKMSDVGRSGRTVLFVSHNMAAVNQLCDRCLWLEGGRSRATGPTEAVIRDYLTEAGDAVADVALEPPPSAEVAVRRAWITAPDGRSAAELDVLECFRVNLDVEVRRPVRDVDVSVWIATVRDTPVFCTNLSDAHGGRIVPLDPGRYSCSFTVPGHFLVPDSYKLTINAHVPRGKSISFHPAALTFSVIETGSALGNEKNPWRYGCVFGQFDWRVTQITDTGTCLPSPVVAGTTGG